MIRSLCALLAGLCTIGCAGGSARIAAPAPPDGALPAQDVEIRLHPYFRDLRTAELQTGTGTLLFLVDSAGGRTLLSAETARQSGCVPSGRDVGYRMTGEPVVFTTCPSFSAKVAGHPVSLQPVAVFDVNRLLPLELPRVDGVLALDALRGQVVTLDWGADRIVLHAAATVDAALAASGIAVRRATGENGAALSVLAPARGRDRTLWFLVDSGNIRGTLVGRHVEAEGQLPAATDGTTPVAIGSRPAVALRVQADDINYDGVLGTDFLRLRPVTLDLRP